MLIEIKTIGVWGFEGSLKGCRMPYESFDKSDSKKAVYFYHNQICSRDCPWYALCELDDAYYCNGYGIGPNDMKLCKKLIAGGSEHRKFLRMIHVQAEICAPRYFTQELATYKIGTAMNSSSTMHLITKRELTEKDICHDGMSQTRIEGILHEINMAIRAYNNETDKLLKEMTFREIKQMLPEGFMQKFVWDANYEVLLNIYHQRKNHRLPEWSGKNGFCDWIKSLPYMGEFIGAME